MFTLTPLPPSLISLVVSVDVKHHVYLYHLFKAQELCETESRSGCPGLPDPIKPCGFCGCKATLNWTVNIQINSVGYKC